MLLIDSNQYLELYRVVAGKRLLDTLREVSDHIFVTRQIVEEVNRNKLDVAAKFLKCQLDTFGLKDVGVPEHLFGASLAETTELRKKVQTLRNDARDLRNEFEGIIERTLFRISRSEDDVSLALASVFCHAVDPTEDEVHRASERKQRGNPPGKKNDPLGDEITWEQFVAHNFGRPKLWVISKDSDFLTTFGDSCFLNPVLFAELESACGDVAEINCFNNLVAGIRHFVDSTGIGRGSIPAPEELDKLERQFIANRFCTGLWLSKDDESHVLDYCSGKWTSPLLDLVITKDRVVVDGMTYPVDSIDPFWAEFVHDGKLYCITE